MIVSHRHRFIFLKTAKTAGTSIEILLSKYCGPDDIITPLTPGDEWLRRSLGGRGYQNCWKPIRHLRSRGYYLMGRRLASRLRAAALRRPELQYVRPLAYTEHMTAARAKRKLPAEVWSSYLKFCVERNPWDRVVSYYYYHYIASGKIGTTLSQWIQSDEVGRASNSEIYMVDGRLAVDRVLRFESLESELAQLLEELGLPAEAELPRAKAGFRPSVASVDTTLSARDVQRIATVFKTEIDLFGFKEPSVGRR